MVTDLVIPEANEAFDSITAARKLQLPLASAHRLSPGVASTVSAVVLTLNVMVGAGLLGEGVTVKFLGLLFVPLTATTTLPLFAPVGTGATIVPEFQLVGALAVPLNVTLLPFCEGPNPDPVIVT